MLAKRRTETPGLTTNAVIAPAGFADCCGQRWYVSVEKVPDLLVFCFHHWKKHALALIAAGWAVDEDRTDELLFRD